MSTNSFGTFASFPPSGSPSSGDWFKCTDSPLSAVYNGSIWVWYYEDIPITIPGSISGFSSDNASLLTVIDQTHGPLYMSIPTGSGSGNLAVKYTPIPSTPYTITVGFKINYNRENTGTAGSLSGWGIALRSSGGAIIYFGPVVITIFSGQAPVLQLAQYASSTGSSTPINGVQDAGLYSVIGGKFYAQVTDDGTNLTFKFGIDKNNLWTFSTVSRASSITPATVGYVANNGTGSEVIIFDSNV